MYWTQLWVLRKSAIGTERSVLSGTQRPARVCGSTSGTLCSRDDATELIGTYLQRVPEVDPQTQPSQHHTSTKAQITYPTALLTD